MVGAHRAGQSRFPEQVGNPISIWEVTFLDGSGELSCLIVNREEFDGKRWQVLGGETFYRISAFPVHDARSKGFGFQPSQVCGRQIVPEFLAREFLNYFWNVVGDQASDCLWC